MRTRRSTVIKTSKKTWKDGQPKAYNSSTFPKSGLLPALHIYRSSRGGWKTGEDAVEGCPVKWYLDYNSRVSRELRSSFIGDSRLTRAVALENKNSPFGFQIHRSVLNSTTHSRILNTWYSLNIRYWIFECCNRNGISCFGLKLEIRFLISYGRYNFPNFDHFVIWSRAWQLLIHFLQSIIISM